MAFRELDDKALVLELASKERDLVQARFTHSMNRLENTASMRVIRRDIARIRTEIRRREIDGGLNADDLVRTHRVAAGTFAGGGASASSGGLLAGVVDKLSE